MKSRTVFVLGMGRSGTSTTADVLRRLGIFWGPQELMMAPQPENPLGFWEFTPLYDINVELLARFGGDWHRPPDLKIGWEKLGSLDDIRKKASSIIAEYFQVPLWGFKDPRCCLTLPFWETVIQNPIECVIPIRNPIEVAASLSHREGLPVSRGLELWMAYVSWAWKSSENLRRIVVSYEHLLKNPREEILRLADFLGVGNGLVGNAAYGVRSDLKHERSSSDELSSRSDVPQVTKKMYLELLKISQNEPDQSVLDHPLDRK